MYMEFTEGKKQFKTIMFKLSQEELQGPYHIYQENIGEVNI